MTGDAGVGQHGVARLLADHVGGGDDEVARDAREDRGVDDAQVPRPAHAEAAVEDGHRVVVAPDLAGARRVVAPGVGAHELAQLLVRPDRLAGDELGGGHARAVRHPPHELDAPHDRVEILVAAGAALVEVAEVDVGHLRRIGRPQRDRPGRVARVGLQDRPGEDVSLAVEVARVAGVVALEARGKPEHEEVGPGHDRDDGAVARVRALPVPPLGEAPVARLAVHGRGEAAPVEQGEPVVAKLAHDAHLVAVLEVRADAGQVDTNRDPVRLELLARADPRELQELRRRERAAGQDHLAADEHALQGGDRLRGRCRARIGAVGVRNVEVLDPDRRHLVVEHDLRDERVRPDDEVPVPLGRGVLDALAGAVPAAVGGRQRHEPEAPQAAAGDPPVVRVEPGAQVAVVVLDAREPLDGASQLGPGGRHDLAEERLVVQRHGGVGQARRQPAAVPVPAAVAEEPLPPVHVRVPLEPLEVARASRRRSRTGRRARRRSHPSPISARRS